METLFCCDSHGNEAVARTDNAHSHHSHASDAHHSHAAEGHSHDSQKHESRESSCCSSLKGVMQTAKPVIVSKLVFHPIPSLCVLLEPHVATLARLEKPPSRQAKTRIWVFTPEVCLGPAFRSLAPPVLL
ncbi:MAG: hypothetical protein ABMA26_21760 [Limisphaerales bacterium]